MKNNGKREFAFKKECERFCQGTASVLKKIHDREEEEQSKKQHKKEKTIDLIMSE
jgi:hypothetical protein